METRKFILSFMTLIMITTGFAYGEKKAASNIKEENVMYTVGNTVYKGFLAYDERLKGKRPAVLVVPEWWGLNDYPKMRVRMLAELGYVALAVDMFGDGKVAVNPTEAKAYTAPFYTDPKLSKTILDVALRKIKEYKQTDPSNIFAIGYCFGGAVVLNAAELGSNFKGVVSFHGGLNGVPANKDLLKAKILICHGAIDKFVTEKDVDKFKHQMDSIGATYTYIDYPNATHAFTNPAATETGKKFNMPIEYNKTADMNSWNDMKKFLHSLVMK